MTAAFKSKPKPGADPLQPVAQNAQEFDSMKQQAETPVEDFWCGWEQSDHDQKRWSVLLEYVNAEKKWMSVLIC